MKYSNAISNFRTPFLKNPWLITMVIAFGLAWAVTFAGTTDVFNWGLENALVFLGIGVLIVTYRRMQFSDLSYTLIFLFACLHIYGAMYTYAENPFGFWLKDSFECDRNHYDRIVHFSFGFLMAYPVREVLLVAFKSPTWLAWLLPIEMTLSVSAFYELVEWGVADIFFPAEGMAYLGTQGDEWDAQKDIMLAVLGAILATSIVSTVKRRFRIE